ncbi:MAG: ABC transporter substrate-binding protein, partial [Acidimicrobiia bacterium]|nr:ABC transporter substrate-binding protein [Acidimicrobiia bacterium]
YINAELGGIDGHPVELVVCAQASPEEAQACAQELSADDLVSVVNMVNIWTLTFDFYGTMGDTPVIGGLPLFDTDYNAANARYFNGGSISVYAAMARFTVEELGVTKVAVLENSNPAANAATELGLLPIYEDMGVEVVRIVVPQPATDVAPQVSEAADVGADAVLVLTSAFECPLIATAAAQFGIPAETMIYSATCTDDTVLDQVGDEMVGAFVARGGYTEDDPWAPEEVQNRIAQTFDLLDTYAPDVPLGGLGPLGFVTMLDIELLYDEIGFDNLDGDTILATMDDGSQRGVLGSFGWACVYADIDLTSVCSGDNLFVQLLPDFTTEPPLSDGFVNGLQLLGG